MLKKFFLEGWSWERFFKLRHEFTPLLVAMFVIGLGIFLYGLWSTDKAKIIGWISKKWKNFIGIPIIDKIIYLLLFLAIPMWVVVLVEKYFLLNRSSLIK